MAAKREKKRATGKARGADLLIDPRLGDIEDDASSTKRRSMLSLFGSMLVEISLPKLIIAWTLLLVLPGLLFGLAPIVFVQWLTVVTDKLASLVLGLWSLLILAVLVTIGWFGWRALFRMTEKNFWSLNSIVVEPSYATFREAFRQLAERFFARNASDAQKGKAARDFSRDRRYSRMCSRPAPALVRLAAHPSVRQRLGNRLVEKDRRGGARQQPRRDLGLSRHRSAGLGVRRCRHGATAYLAQICRAAEKATAPGVWCICPTSTSWGSAMVFASKAAGLALGATNG